MYSLLSPAEAKYPRTIPEYDTQYPDPGDSRVTGFGVRVNREIWKQHQQTRTSCDVLTRFASLDVSLDATSANNSQ
jgi:hypothetical protein